MLMLGKEQIIKKIDIVLQEFSRNEYQINNDRNPDRFQSCQRVYSLLCDTIRNFAPGSSYYYYNSERLIENCNIEKTDSLCFATFSLGQILKSLKIAYENDLLIDVNEIIHANIFNDFLEMGEYLLSEGFKDAAAVMIGGVLEDQIKKLCQKNGILILNSASLPLKTSQLNSDLYTQNAITRGDNKNIIAWLEIRNNAAHAKYSEYSDEQVRIMLQGVRDFIVRFPA